MNSEKEFFSDFRATLSDQPWNYLETCDSKNIKENLKSNNVDLSSSSAYRKQLIGIYTEILHLIKAEQLHKKSQEFDPRLDIATHEFRCSCTRKFNLTNSSITESPHESHCSSRKRSIKSESNDFRARHESSIGESICYSERNVTESESKPSSVRSHYSVKEDNLSRENTIESRFSSIKSYGYSVRTESVNSSIRSQETPGGCIVRRITTERYVSRSDVSNNKVSSVKEADSEGPKASVTSHDSIKEPTPSPRSLVESLQYTSTEDFLVENVVRRDSYESLRPVEDHESVHVESDTDTESVRSEAPVDELVGTVSVRTESFSVCDSVKDSVHETIYSEHEDIDSATDVVEIKEEVKSADLESVKNDSVSLTDGDSVKTESLSSADSSSVVTSPVQSFVDDAPSETQSVCSSVTAPAESPAVDSSQIVESSRSDTLSFVESPAVEKSFESSDTESIVESPHIVSTETASVVESPVTNESSSDSVSAVDSPHIVSSESVSVASESLDSYESEDESVVDSPSVDKQLESVSESDSVMNESVVSGNRLDDDVVDTPHDEIISDEDDSESLYCDNTSVDSPSAQYQGSEGTSISDEQTPKYADNQNNEQPITTQYSTCSSKSRILEKTSRRGSGNIQERELQADLIQLLESVPILSDLPRERLLDLSNYFHLRSYFANSAIILAGEVPKEFFILASGTVSSYTYKGPNKANVFKRGYRGSDYFGEMEVINNCASSEYIFADSHVTVQSISADDFRTLLGDLFPEFISRATSQLGDLSGETIVEDNITMAMDVLDNVQIFLETLPIISKLSNLHKVAKRLHYDRFMDKEIIAAISKSNRFFMIYEGTISVQIFDERANRQLELFTLGPGMFVSSVLLSEMPDNIANPSFVASEGVVLLSLENKDFENYFGEKVLELREYLEMFYKSDIKSLGSASQSDHPSERLHSVDSLCSFGNNFVNYEVESAGVTPSSSATVEHTAILPLSDEDSGSIITLPLDGEEVGVLAIEDGNSDNGLENVSESKGITALAIENDLERAKTLAIEDYEHTNTLSIDDTKILAIEDARISAPLDTTNQGIEGIRILPLEDVELSHDTDICITRSGTESSAESVKDLSITSKTVIHTAGLPISTESSNSLDHSCSIASEMSYTRMLPFTLYSSTSQSMDILSAHSAVEDMTRMDSVQMYPTEKMESVDSVGEDIPLAAEPISSQSESPVTLEKSDSFVENVVRRDSYESLRPVEDHESVHVESDTDTESVRSEAPVDELVGTVSVRTESFSVCDSVKDSVHETIYSEHEDIDSATDVVEIKEEVKSADLESVKNDSVSLTDGDSVKTESLSSADSSSVVTSPVQSFVDDAPSETQSVCSSVTAPAESPAVDSSQIVESSRSDTLSFVESPAVEKSFESSDTESIVESPHIVSTETASVVESPVTNESSSDSVSAVDSPHIVSSESVSVASESLDSYESEDESVVDSPSVDKQLESVSESDSVMNESVVSGNRLDDDVVDTPHDEIISDEDDSESLYCDNTSVDSPSAQYQGSEGTSISDEQTPKYADNQNNEQLLYQGSDTESVEGIPYDDSDSEYTNSSARYDSEDALESLENTDELESVIAYDEETLNASKMLLLSTLKNKYRSLGAAFVSMDADHSGVVSRDEFLDFIDKLGIGAIEEGELYLLYEMLRGPDEDSLTFSSFYMNSGEKVNTLAEFNTHLIQLFGSSRVAFERYFGSLKRNTTCSRTDFTMLAANVGIIEPEVSILFHELDVCRNGYVTVMTILKMVVGDWDRDTAIENEKKATSSYRKLVNYIQKGDTRDFSREFSKSISINFFDSNVDGSLITPELEEFAVYDELKHFDVISCALLSHEPFLSLSLPQRRYVASLLLIRELEANESIMDRGDVDNLYLVLEGSLTMHYRAYLYDTNVELRVGEFCNLDSFIQSQPTQSTVTCTSFATVGIMTAECYRDIVWPIIEMRIKRVPVITQFLRSIESFNLFSDQELDCIASASTIRSFKLHETIIKKGDPPDWFYIIFEGSAVIALDNNLEISKRRTVEKMSHICAGDLIDNCNHNFTLIANSTVVLLSWERTEFFRVFNKTGAISRNDVCRMDSSNGSLEDPTATKRVTKRVSFAE